VDYLSKRDARRATTWRPPYRQSRAPAAALMFLGTALWLTAATFAINLAKPSVHPMAIVRTAGKPNLCGEVVP
jgi:hypothetical protein